MQYGGQRCRAIRLPEDHGRTTVCVAAPVDLFYEKSRADNLAGSYVLLPMKFVKTIDQMGQEQTHWIGMDWRVGKGRIIENAILFDEKSHSPVLWDAGQVQRNKITGEGLHPDITVVTREVEWMLAMRLEKRSRKCLKCEKAIPVLKKNRIRVLLLLLHRWKLCKHNISERVFEYAWGKEFSACFYMYMPRNPRWHYRIAQRHDLRLSRNARKRHLLSNCQRSWWREMPPRVFCKRCGYDCPEICYYHKRTGCTMETCMWYKKKSMFLDGCDDRATFLHKLLHKSPVRRNGTAGRKRRWSTSAAGGRC